MNNNEWLHTFMKEKYNIVMTDELINENFFGNIIKLTVPEVAYLLIRLSEQYSIPVKSIIEYVSSDITYKSLLSVVDVLKE